MPGVVKRWKKINQKLIFFDCAFDILNDEPEFYNDICRGLTELKLACYPNIELIVAREKYFECWKQNVKVKIYNIQKKDCSKMNCTKLCIWYSRMILRIT